MPKVWVFRVGYVGVGQNGYGSLLWRQLVKESLLSGGKGRNLSRFQAAITASATV